MQHKSQRVNLNGRRRRTLGAHCVPNGVPIVQLEFPWLSEPWEQQHRMAMAAMAMAMAERKGKTGLLLLSRAPTALAGLPNFPSSPAAMTEETITTMMMM